MYRAFWVIPTAVMGWIWTIFGAHAISSLLYEYFLTLEEDGAKWLRRGQLIEMAWFIARHWKPSWRIPRLAPRERRLLRNPFDWNNADSYYKLAVEVRGRVVGIFLEPTHVLENEVADGESWRPWGR